MLKYLDDASFDGDLSAKGLITAMPSSKLVEYPRIAINSETKELIVHLSPTESYSVAMPDEAGQFALVEEVSPKIEFYKNPTLDVIEDYAYWTVTLTQSFENCPIMQVTDSDGHLSIVDCQWSGPSVVPQTVTVKLHSTSQIPANSYVLTVLPVQKTYMEAHKNPTLIPDSDNVAVWTAPLVNLYRGTPLMQVVSTDGNIKITDVQYDAGSVPQRVIVKIKSRTTIDASSYELTVFGGKN